jgi:hypothetical protein
LNEEDELVSLEGTGSEEDVGAGHVGIAHIEGQQHLLHAVVKLQQILLDRAPTNTKALH